MRQRFGAGAVWSKGRRWKPRGRTRSKKRRHNPPRLNRKPDGYVPSNKWPGAAGRKGRIGTKGKRRRRAKRIEKRRLGRLFWFAKRAHVPWVARAGPETCSD